MENFRCLFVQSFSTLSRAAILNYRFSCSCRFKIGQILHLNFTSFSLKKGRENAQTQMNPTNKHSDTQQMAGINAKLIFVFAVNFSLHKSAMWQTTILRPQRSFVSSENHKPYNSQHKISGRDAMKWLFKCLLFCEKSLSLASRLVHYLTGATRTISISKFVTKAMNFPVNPHRKQKAACLMYSCAIYSRKYEVVNDIIWDRSERK